MVRAIVPKKNEHESLRKTTFTQLRSSLNYLSEPAQVFVKHLQMQNNVLNSVVRLPSASEMVPNIRISMK